MENAKKAMGTNYRIAKEAIESLLRQYEKILKEIKELSKKVETLAIRR